MNPKPPSRKETFQARVTKAIFEINQNIVIITETIDQIATAVELLAKDMGYEFKPKKRKG